MADVHGYFASLWALETAHKPIRFGEKTSSPASLLDLGTRMLAILCSGVSDATKVVAVRTGRWCTSGTSADRPASRHGAEDTTPP